MLKENKFIAKAGELKTDDQNRNEQLRGVSFWTDKIKEAGLNDKLRFFNDLVTEKRPPHLNSGYGEPVLKDVTLGDKTCDVYHTDHKNSDHWHRLFIHIKN